MGIIDRDWYQERWKKRILGDEDDDAASSAETHEALNRLFSGAQRQPSRFPWWIVVALGAAVALGVAFSFAVRYLAR